MNAIIGQPISRVDGPAKVTGQAIYAAEFNLTQHGVRCIGAQHDCARAHRAAGCHELRSRRLAFWQSSRT